MSVRSGSQGLLRPRSTCSCGVQNKTFVKRISPLLTVVHVSLEMGCRTHVAPVRDHWSRDNRARPGLGNFCSYSTDDGSIPACNTNTSECETRKTWCQAASLFRHTAHQIVESVPVCHISRQSLSTHIVRVQLRQRPDEDRPEHAQIGLHTVTARVSRPRYHSRSSMRTHTSSPSDLLSVPTLQPVLPSTPRTGIPVRPSPSSLLSSSPFEHPLEFRRAGD